MSIRLLSAVIGLLGAVLGPQELRQPPSAPPAYTEPHPTLAANGYVSHTESIVIDVARSDYLRWVNDPELHLGDLIQSDDDATRVVRTDILIGAWDAGTDRTGDRRRVQFASGHYLVEEVLDDTSDTFRYMVWGFTEPQQRYAVDHAVAAFTFRDHDGRTEVSWTYSFQPTAAPLRPLVSTFVGRAMPALMRETLAAMKSGAEAATGSPRTGQPE
ncbi:SRPBCC family protein [Nocardia abscessus]|uniref:SRPBCC family protein n=1 Tax=Nocardia abscessus TaxID=120957 RepID=UPI001894960C|nr:SRPBCC family protein [Nocardia abscessus]MBF6337167.1 SRPBCC family protein [Nocardia abscessus]